MIRFYVEENKTVYSGTIQEGTYLPEGGGIQRMPKKDKSNDVIVDKTVARTIYS